MQQPALTFPTVTPVSQEDFFSRDMTIIPTPEVLAVLEKHTPEPDVVGAPDSEPAQDVQDPQPDTTGAPISVDGITPEVAALLEKHKPDVIDVVVPEKGAPKTPKTEVPEVAGIEPGAASDADADIQVDVPYYKVAEMLQEKGLIVEIPEGFPVDDVNQDNFWQLIEHNFSKKADEEFGSGYEAARNDLTKSISEETLEILNFQLENPNASQQEVRYHIERILYAKDVSALDPSDPLDAETIIRQYWALDSTHDEIEFQVKEAKDLNALEQRAQMWKPKVEQRAQADVNQSRQYQQQILQQDAQRHQGFMDKVDEVLKTNKILGVEIGQEERAKVRAIFANNKVPVPVNGGQTVELGLMDYLVRKNMYGQGGKVENLLLAALVLEDGAKALEKYIANPIKKEAAIKFQTQAAKGTFSATPAASRNNSSPQILTAEKKREAFFSNLRQSQGK